MVVRLAGRVTLVSRVQSQKEAAPILDRLEERVMLVNSVHPENASSSMLVTLEGSV